MLGLILGYSINSNIFNIGTRFSHFLRQNLFNDMTVYFSGQTLSDTKYITFYLYRKMPGPAIYKIFNTFMAHNCTQRPEIVAC